jgi:uncharacterized protein (TIGR02246 family)
MVQFPGGIPMIKFRALGLATLVVLAAITLASCRVDVATDRLPEGAPVADNRAADEAKIRSGDEEWVKSVAGKDAQKSASYYADGGALMAPGVPLATGKDAVQKMWVGMMGTPGFALTFAPTKVEVSPSGDLAYEIGEYQLTSNDKKGKPQTVKAKYVVVWGKQPDGSWKALVDAPTTTQ